MSVEVVLIVTELEDWANESCGQEKDVANKLCDWRELGDFSWTGVSFIQPILVVEGESDIQKDLHHEDSCNINIIFPISYIHSPDLNCNEINKSLNENNLPNVLPRRPLTQTVENGLLGPQENHFISEHIKLKQQSGDK